MNKIRELNILYQITKELGELGELSTLSRKIVALVSEYFNVQLVLLIFSSDKKNNNNCKLAASNGIIVPTQEEAVNDCLVELSEYGKNIKEIKFTEGIEFKEIIKEFALESLLVVSLKNGEKYLGSLILGCSENGGQGHLEKSLDLINAASLNISAAIDNHLLFDELLSSNRELVEMQNHLVESAKLASIGQLAGGTAHEINNPLQIILGTVQMMLLDMNYANPLKKDLESIVEETERIGIIVRGLLDFAKTETEEKDKYKPIELIPILRDSIKLVSNQMHLEQIVVKKDFDKNIPLIKGSRNQLKQVFINLLINAQHAMEGGGELIIKTYTEANTVFLSFTDNGIGISKNTIDSIFNPFFTTKGPDRGTGLGLSISQRIIIDHKGKIEVESKEGQGSTFYIKLPAYTDGQNHNF